MYPCRTCGRRAIWSWFTLGMCDRCRNNDSVLFPLWRLKDRNMKKALEIIAKLRASGHVRLHSLGEPLRNFVEKSVLEQLYDMAPIQDAVYGDWKTDCIQHWKTKIMDLQSTVFCECGYGDQNHDRYTCQDVWCFCLLDRNSLNKEVNPLLIQPISN
jgi:hypothetical protein